MVENFQEIREACCEANKKLPMLGLVDLTFGNVSVLDRARGVFAIKPSGVAYDAITPSDMVLVDMEGNTVKGDLRPSSDMPTHACLFRAFKGVNAVVHTHSRNATAWAQAGRGITCLGTTHADYFYGEVPVTRPMTTEEIQGAYELETGKVIVERFKNLNPLEVSAILVNGHGPFAWGSTSNKAVENALALEIVAEMALKTLQLNQGKKPVTEELLNKHFKRKHGSSAYYGQKY